MKEQLIFIYNANSGKGNALVDIYHKIAHPESYSCDLCKLTHGIFTEKKKWKDFRLAHDTPEMQFLHTDEFLDRYKSKFGYKFEFPVVLVTSGSDLEIFISKEELNRLEKLDDLIELVLERYY
ncbi:GTPase [Flavobacteriaceae bacterium M23B6Z8]